MSERQFRSACLMGEQLYRSWPYHRRHYALKAGSDRVHLHGRWTTRYEDGAEGWEEGGGGNFFAISFSLVFSPCSPTDSQCTSCLPEPPSPWGTGGFSKPEGKVVTCRARSRTRGSHL